MAKSFPLGAVKIRSAEEKDIPAIFQLIQALAEYEKLSHQVTGSAEQLRQHLFGAPVYAYALVAEWDGKVVGLGLYFYNYSTFLTQPGIYLEDLFVLPEYRRRGIGKALLQHLAQNAIAQGLKRFEWSVLDWNEPAIAFYQNMGAQVLPDWRICRVTGEALAQLASSTREREKN